MSGGGRDTNSNVYECMGENGDGGCGTVRVIASSGVRTPYPCAECGATTLWEHRPDADKQAAADVVDTLARQGGTSDG